jgi:hypothetical protein
MALTKVTYSMIADNVVNVADFIPAGVNPAATDCIAYFNAAIAAGSSVFIPEGEYRIDSTLVVPNNKILFGESRDTSIISYTGTGNGIEVGNNPVNGSGYGNSQLKNFKIRALDNTNTGAGIAMNSGGYSYYEVDLMWSTGFFYGIVIDQTEISHFHRSIFEAGSQTAGAAMWITNGAEWRVGGLKRFTNGLTIQDNQFNGGNYNIIDDGGNVHVFIENNLNGAELGACHFAGITGLTFMGHAYETAYGVNETNLFFSVSSGATGSDVKGPCLGATITGNTFSAKDNTSAACIDFPSGNLPSYHRGFTISNNFFTMPLGGAPAAIDVTALSQSFCGFNYDTGPSGDPRAHYAGIHNDANGNVLYPPTGENNPDSVLPYSFGDTENSVRFAGGFGYDTGAGGAVTQLTNKSTSVTLNKQCGKITMNNALLSAGASVSFGLNNTFIKNTDIVLVNIVAGAGGVDSANYQVWAAPSSGNNLAIINLQNISGGNLSEAVELNFSVIKSVTT